MQMDIFRKRNKQFAVFLSVLIVLTSFSVVVTQYDVIKSFTSLPKAVIWMAENFYPNKKAIERLPTILLKLKETIFLSIAATTTASVFALLFGVLGSKTTKINNVISSMARLVASAFRNIPDTVWAMILLFSFGQNAMTGYLALFFTTFGMLTRAFIETIDEASQDSVEALEASGASFLQTVFQAIIPSSMPQLISWILFMIETNIRSSTLIGMLTGTGIGNTFNLYYKSLNYGSASLVVISIVITVFIIEFISNHVRRVIL